jgi:hypothetical protein
MPWRNAGVGGEAGAMCRMILVRISSPPPTSNNHQRYRMMAEFDDWRLLPMLLTHAGVIPKPGSGSHIELATSLTNGHMAIAEVQYAISTTLDT